MNYENDIKPKDDAATVQGVGAITDGGPTVDVSADDPDLSSIVAGQVLWIDYPSLSTRRFALISSVDNTAKTIRCTTTLDQEVDDQSDPVSMVWGISDNAAIATALDASKLTHQNILITPDASSPNTQSDTIKALLGKKYRVFYGDVTTGGKQGALKDLAASDQTIGFVAGLLMDWMDTVGMALRCNEDASDAQNLLQITSVVAGIVDQMHSANPVLQPYTGQDVRDDIARLSGGLRYDGVDAAAVQAVRVAYTTTEATRLLNAERQAARDGIQARAQAATNAVRDAFNDGSKSPAEITAAGESAFGP